LFNSIFTPDDLPYPLPILQQSTGYGNGSQVQCGCNSGNASSSNCSSGAGGASTGNASSGGGASSSAGNAGTASGTASSGTDSKPAASTPTEAPPQQIIINVTTPAPAAPVAAAPASGAPAAASSPTASTDPAPTVPTSSAPIVRAAPISTMRVQGDPPPPPTDTIVKAYAYNPRLRARVPKAQEQLLEELLQEQITMRMLHGQSAPVAFVVPDGFNAVDFYLGAIELNPDAGKSEDLDLIVTLGDVKLSANAQSGAGALSAGDQITVTASWRYASWVELAQEHLRVPIFARFYTIENF
jgi:hypothetical protein